MSVVVSVLDERVLAKEQRDAPDAGKTDNGVDDSADSGELSAENPGNDVKAEDPDAAPS